MGCYLRHDTVHLRNESGTAARWPLGGLALAAVLLVLVLAASGASAEGTIYRYVDSEGVVHFTNVTKDASYSVVSMGGGRARLHPEFKISAPKQARFDRVIARADSRVGLEIDPGEAYDVSVSTPTSPPRLPTTWASRTEPAAWRTAP